MVYALLEEMHMYYSFKIPLLLLFSVVKIKENPSCLLFNCGPKHLNKSAADQLDLLSNYEAMQAKQAEDPSKG